MGPSIDKAIREHAIDLIGMNGLGLLAFIGAMGEPITLSRRELSAATGLARNTLGKILDTSIAAGWIIAGQAGRLTTWSLPDVVRPQDRTTTTISTTVSSGDRNPIEPPLAPPLDPSPPVVPVVPSGASGDDRSEARPPNDTKDTTRRTRKRPTSQGDATIDQPFPPMLDTVAFRSAWGDWVQYRRERRSPLTPSTVRSQLREMEKAGELASVAAIHESINRGWIGVFPQNHTTNGTTVPHVARKTTNTVGPGQRFQG